MAFWRLATAARRFARPVTYRGAIVAAVTALGLLGSALPALADRSTSYLVQPGDTPAAIAQAYGVSVSDLQAANPGLDLARLDVGEALTIPTVNASPTASSVALSWPGAHFPAFAITPNGLVVRALSPMPQAPPDEPIISAPYFSQFDGSVYAASNCGPTSLAMALGALQITSDPISLRFLAMEQMRDDDPDNGTTWEALAFAARQYGASPAGLFIGRRYRTWSFDNLQAELALGRPVLLEVRYWDLPEHVQSTYGGDHYIVALGLDRDGNLVFHDPAVHGYGAYRVISPGDLLPAWTDTADGHVRTAMALTK